MSSELQKVYVRPPDLGYDFEGRLSKVSRPDGLVAYGYEESTGRLVEMETSLSQTKYEYDLLGRLARVDEWKRNGNTHTLPVRTEYAYAKDGQVERITYRYDTTIYRDSVMTYDADRRWLDTVTNKGVTGATASSFTYTRRADGQVTGVTESMALAGGGTESNTATFTYDGANRLISERLMTNAAMENYQNDFTYDLVGNRREVTKSFVTSGGQTFSPVTTTSTYNGRDQLLTETTSGTTITHGYDSNGSLTSKGSDTFAYDVRGRLSGSTAGGVSSSYQYTVDGIRSAVTTGGSTAVYLIDGMSPSGYAQVIEERTSAGLLIAQYVYGVGLDASAVYRPDQQGGVYLGDGHSGIRQIVDGSGAVVWSRRYDAYGQAVKQAGSYTNPLGYRGERFDATLGNYYLRARDYDPRSGRFTQVDPFGGNYGDPLQIMRYGYAGGNPVGMMDPSGMFTGVGGLTVGMAIGNSLATMKAGVDQLIFSAVTATIRGYELGLSPGQVFLNYWLEDVLGIPVDLLVSSYRWLMDTGIEFIDYGVAAATNSLPLPTNLTAGKVYGGAVTFNIGKNISQFVRKIRIASIDTLSTRWSSGGL